MAGTPVRILLVRHGETVYNVERRWQGQSDSPLTERGIAQARQLANALASQSLNAIYSSDLGRAMHTARIVADQHGLAVQPEPGLREFDTGTWTGKSHFELQETDAAGLEQWSTAPARMHLPGGEGLAEAQARALAFIRERMPRHIGETVLLVTHGGIGQTILIHAMGGTLEDLWLKQAVDNCQISRLEWTPEQGLTLVELADVRHLEEVGSLRRTRVPNST